MSLLTPLGFLGLIGVLVLILIYILKPKFQEKSISSTFIWKLSLKYRKQRIPFQWLKSSIIVILQFAVLTLITLALTTPLLALNTQSGEKIVILDASANMLTESNGRTRFERAIQEIGALADQTTPEDRFTVILASHEPSFIARRLDSARFIKQLLSETIPTYGSADISAAIKLTEGVLAENPYAEVILFTGNQYLDTGTIKVRDMSNDEWNVAILDFSTKIEQGYYQFTTELGSFNRNMDIAVKLYIDDVLRDAKVIQVNDNETVKFTWDGLYILNYAKAEVVVEYNDDFPYDNHFAIYGWENERFNVQLVSESPRFLQAALLTLGKFKIDIPSPPEIGAPMPIKYEGYDLYIFDSITPENMPIDGAVWLINLDEMPTGIPLTLGTELNGDFTLTTPLSGSSKEASILNLVRPAQITVSKYRYISNHEQFHTILSNASDPLLLTKDINGQSLVVFGFSLHHSNLPIIPDYIALMHNLSTYSVQNMVERFIFYPGDQIDVRKKSSALSMTIQSPNGETTYDTFPVSFRAETPGSYTITQQLALGEISSVDFFVRIPENQSNFNYNYGLLSSPLVSNGSENVDASQDTMDLIYILVAVLIVIMLIEWRLHYNEHN
jgi:Ca-activated chloride channel homolog